MKKNSLRVFMMVLSLGTLLQANDGPSDAKKEGNSSNKTAQTETKQPIETNLESRKRKRDEAEMPLQRTTTLSITVPTQEMRENVLVKDLHGLFIQYDRRKEKEPVDKFDAIKAVISENDSQKFLKVLATLNKKYGAGSLQHQGFAINITGEKEVDRMKLLTGFEKMVGYNYRHNIFEEEKGRITIKIDDKNSGYSADSDTE